MVIFRIFCSNSSLLPTDLLRNISGFEKSSSLSSHSFKVGWCIFVEAEALFFTCRWGFLDIPPQIKKKTNHVAPTFWSGKILKKHHLGVLVRRVNFFNGLTSLDHPDWIKVTDLKIAACYRCKRKKRFFRSMHFEALDTFRG